MKDCFPKDIYFLYYANKEQFTRIVEYKRFTKYDSSTRLSTRNFSKWEIYPMPTEDEQDKARKYHDYLPLIFIA